MTRHRPPTYEEQASIVEYLKAGNYFETACAAAGVRVPLARAWLAAGIDPDSETAEFRREVLRAMAEAEASLVGYLHGMASAGDAKAAIALLERRYPERWCQKIRHHVEKELSGGVDRVVALEPEIGAETVERVLDALAGDVRGPETEVEAASDYH